MPCNIRVVREAQNPREARVLQREQDEFIARRNAGFGRPGYDLQKAMRERLQRLTGSTAISGRCEKALGGTAKLFRLDLPPHPVTMAGKEVPGATP